MVSMLSLKPEDLILEPCGGEGAFIDTLLEKSPQCFIDTVDLNDESIDIMKMKYSEYPNIKIRKTNTLTDDIFDKYSISGHYDKIIGNPPYGGWQDYEQRDLLKKKYSGFYVKETYSLFLLRCISLLKKNGTLSFVIPDTFLYLHNHKELRKTLLFDTSIKEILIFPSKLFPGVSFGYSKLCIITIEKKNNPMNQINIYKNITREEDFEAVMNKEDLSKFELITLDQESIKKNESYTFYLNNKTAAIMSNSKLCLNDIADCVTGIYTGDNKGYIYADNEGVKGSKDYKIVDHEFIDHDCENLTGTSHQYKYVPIIKGNSSSAYTRKTNDWYIDWRQEAIKFYNTNKKSRFQNSQYYFKKGIAVPMVKSSKIRATIFDKKVFDQSIVGVFPREEKYILFILGLLNSNIAKDLLFNINPTANNSANYIKRIPIALPSEEELKVINTLVNNLIENQNDDQSQEKLDHLYLSVYRYNIL